MAERALGGARRPELTIPLAGGPLAALRGVFATRRPAFDRARANTLRLAATAGLLLVLGQFAVVEALRAPVTALAVAVAVFAGIRVASLSVLERRQRRFVPAWLAEASAELRAQEFEVVRFAADDHVYDLSDPDSTARLLRDADGNARLVVDFAYPPANLEHAHRRMREVRIERVSRPGTPATVRFPEARYGLAASGLSTFWSLGPLAVITAARPGDREEARAGTGTPDRPS